MTELDEALRHGVHRGLAAWQLLMIGAVLATSTAGDHLALVGAHVLVAVVALVTRTRQHGAAVLLAGVYVVTTLDLAVAEQVDSPLAFLAVWSAILQTATPLIALPIRRGALVSAVAAVGTASALTTLQPAWPSRVTVSAALTGLTVAAMTGVFRSAVSRHAAVVDAEAREARNEARRLALAQRVAQESAEDSRVMHDTVINTLSAIASGGAAVSDHVLVRERCAADVDQLERRLRGDHRVRTTLTSSAWDLGTTTVARRGLDDHDVTAAFRALPEAARGALAGAVDELVRNAHRHSGAALIEVRAHVDGGDLRVTVRDDGRGFDGEVVEGHGLAESVLRRLDGVGARLDLRATPSTGTTAGVAMPVGAERGHADAATPVDPPVLRRALWVWSWGIVAIAAVGEVVRPISWDPATAVAVVMAAILLCVAAISAREGGPSRLATLALLLGAPALMALVLLGASTPADLFAPAVALPLAPLSALALMARRPPAAAVGALALPLTAVATALATPDAAIDLSLHVLATIPTLGLVLGLTGFGQELDHLASSSLGTARERDAIAVELEATRELETTRQRWTEARLDAATGLLTDVADGTLDPAAPAVRDRARTEERHLRQVLTLDPGNVHLAPVLARTLGEARDHGIALEIRTGPVQVDEDASARVGRLVSAALGELSPGEVATLGMFTLSGIVRCSLLVPSPAGRLSLLTTRLADHPDVELQQLDARVAMELELRA